MALGLLATVGVTGYFLFYQQSSNELATAGIGRNQGTARSNMTLVVTPPWAKVMLNGEEIGPVGETGRLEVALPANDGAMAWLEVSADGYHPVRRPLSAYGGVDSVAVELVPMPFQAVIRTTPPRAEVWIDNELKGYSPVTLTLLPTEDTVVTIKQPGRAEVSRTIPLPERGEILELDISLPAANVIVQVDSEPPGAMIAMDGIVRGPTPLAVEMDRSYLGKDVEITATLAGYEPATLELALPGEGGGRAVPAVLTLSPKQAAVEIWTLPPGGRVSVGGKDAGTAPVTVRFEAAQIGSQVLVSASMGTTHFGKQEIIVPPLDEPMRVTVPMEFNAQRVVLILSCPSERPLPKALANIAPVDASPAEDAFVERITLTDQLVEVLHALSPKQRFALLVETDDGIEAWPGGLDTEAASNEQKIRAYDAVRSARLPGAGQIKDALRQALRLAPNTIWVFTTGEVSRETIEAFGETAGSETVAVHIVRTRPAEQDEWLRDWTLRRQGTLTILGLDKLPAIALGEP